MSFDLVKPYVPRTNEAAEKLMYSVARRMGFRIKFNSHGDWLVYKPNRRRRVFVGVICQIDSPSNPGTPSPVASRWLSPYRNELEELRGAMNDVLMEAGMLDGAGAEIKRA